MSTLTSPVAQASILSNLMDSHAISESELFEVLAAQKLPVQFINLLDSFGESLVLGYPQLEVEGKPITKVEFFLNRINRNQDEVPTSIEFWGYIGLYHHNGNWAQNPNAGGEVKNLVTNIKFNSTIGVENFDEETLQRFLAGERKNKLADEAKKKDGTTLERAKWWLIPSKDSALQILLGLRWNTKMVGKERVRVKELAAFDVLWSGFEIGGTGANQSRPPATVVTSVPCTGTNAADRYAALLAASQSEVTMPIEGDLALEDGDL